MEYNDRPHLQMLLAERKWAFILIFFIILFNPLFYFLSEDVGLKDKCFAWLTCLAAGSAFSAIDLFFSRKTEKIYLSVLFALSCAPNLIVWSYLYLFGIYFRREMFRVIFDSNIAEGREYLNQFIPWICFAVALLYMTVGFVCILKARASTVLAFRQGKKFFAALFLALAMIVGFKYLSQAVPVIEFYKSYLLFKAESKIFQLKKIHRGRMTMKVECSLPTETRHIFVVLIGESTSTCHMSLYGYSRATTPFMDARASELDIYTDVVTPDTYTIGVLQKVLTLAGHEHPEYYHSKASIMEIFNVAGFETYWISNQVFLSKWGGSYGVIASLADHVRDLSASGKPDGILLPAFREALHNGVEKNKVIFVHLMGSHHSYACRYPKTFTRFDHRQSGDLTDAGFRTDDMKATIDAYDNSILYGDSIYNALLTELELTNTSSYLLYFSDHGEEVFDTRNACGHFLSNVWPCQCKIPFVLWRSERYRRENPHIVIDTARPYSTENVIHAISTLSGFEYPDYDPSLSIFTTAYAKPEVRMVGQESYEKVLKKTDK